MSTAARDDDDAGEPKYVGAPIELFRATNVLYADQALADWDAYVRRTLGASLAQGGRFNPQCEFGALYTTDDRDTAWVELAARLAREGQEGIPPDMRLLRLIVTDGTYVELTSAESQAVWDIAEEVLRSDDPSSHDQALCWNVGRGIRAIADFLQSSSARSNGLNIPLFPDREGGTLRVALARVEPDPAPEHLREQSVESW